MSERTALDLRAIPFAEVTMPLGYVFRPRGGNRLTHFAGLLRPGGESVRAPCLAYVIRHPFAGDVLVDTGLHPAALESLRRDYGSLLGTFFQTLRVGDRSFDEQLRELDVDPRDVQSVVMTHLHVDHTSGMRLFPNASFVCSRKEWTAANERGAVRNGYASHHLPAVSRMRLVDLDLIGEPHGPFTRTTDLLGDGSIRLVSTPGHTRGHMSVLVRLPDNREVLLVGDAAYTLRSIREGTLPLLTVSDGAYRRSLAELKAYAEAEPDATLVPSHDPSAYRALARAGAGEGRPSLAASRR